MWRMFTNRRVLLSMAAVLALLGVALWPRAIAVDAGAVTRGPLAVTIDEEGETRVHDRFIVSAPVSGRVERIELEPGDRVTRNKTVVARLRPDAPALLDARSRAEAEAAVESARSGLGRARAEEQRARAAEDLAHADLKRERDLDRAGLTTKQSFDAKVAAAQIAEEAVRAAVFAVAAASSEYRAGARAVDACHGRSR